MNELFCGGDLKSNYYYDYYLFYGEDTYLETASNSEGRFNFYWLFLKSCLIMGYDF